jgi:hypothetical protein
MGPPPDHECRGPAVVGDSNKEVGIFIVHD